MAKGIKYDVNIIASNRGYINLKIYQHEDLDKKNM